jgi:hypothetical protein
VAEEFPVSLVLRSFVAAVRELKLCPCRKGTRYRVVEHRAHAGRACVRHYHKWCFVVAQMNFSIRIDTESGSRIATASTARHISIANRALAVSCRHGCAYAGQDAEYVGHLGVHVFLCRQARGTKVSSYYLMNDGCWLAHEFFCSSAQEVVVQHESHLRGYMLVG